MNSAILKAIKDWCTRKFQTKGDYLTKVPEGYVTKTELEAKKYVTQDDILPTEKGMTEAEVRELVNELLLDNMKGASALAAGKAGLVPAPDAGKQDSFLKGDGTWAVPANTTYSNFVKSGSGAKAGLVPKPPTTAGTTKYLREDGTWQVPPDTDTTYPNMAGASALVAGKAGLVPAPGAGKQNAYLRGDGTYVTPATTLAGTEPGIPLDQTMGPEIVKRIDALISNLSKKLVDFTLASGVERVAGFTWIRSNVVCLSTCLKITKNIAANTNIITAMKVSNVPINVEWTYGICRQGDKSMSLVAVNSTVYVEENLLTANGEYIIISATCALQ